MTESASYWKGEGLDLESLWTAFDQDPGYADKVRSSDLHVLRLTFAGHSPMYPLFDLEVIYKTVQGTFHDVKREALTPAAYDRAAPIFLNRVARGSGIFEFLGQLDPVLTWVVALGGAAMWYRRAMASDQAFDNQRLQFLRDHFPNANAEDRAAYMKAWSTFSRRRVMHRLLGQDLSRVEVSSLPHHVDQGQAMIDMQPIVTIDGQPSGSDPDV